MIEAGIKGIARLFFAATVLIALACSSGNRNPQTSTKTIDSKDINGSVAYPADSFKTGGKRISYKGHSFDTYILPYSSIQKIRLYWKDDSGKKLKSLATLKQYVESKGEELLFATNAGMYTTDNSPKGLYIENGKELVPIERRTNASGNFYIQPNGVFFTTKSGAKIVMTQEFDRYKNEAIYATQSGPMLVLNDSINRNFTEGSKNVNIRSGVGLNAEGETIFAISNEEVNFYDFAAFFKDKLHCSTALYLDGFISKMYLPEIGRDELDGSFGGMVGVVR